MADEPTLPIEFGQGINLEHAEEAVRQLGAPPHIDGAARLDFRHCRHIDVGAGARIGNALRRWAQAGRLDILVPPFESPKSMGRLWYQTFTRSGLGLAIAEHAQSVTSDTRNVSDVISTYYRDSLRTLSQNLVLFRGLHERRIDVEDSSSFLATFREWLPFVNVHQTTVEAKDVTTLAAFCFELIQNVVDHAAKAPLAETAILSYVSLRFYKRLSGSKAFSGSFAAYRDRLHLDLRNHPEYSGLLEVVVNDDGVGIAARQSLQADIYWGPIEEERHALEVALRAGGSVKLRARDTTPRGDPGYGFTHTATSLSRLKAHASLRTGRLLAVFDGSSNDADFTVADQVYGYMPGTMVQVIVPIRPRQLRLHV